MAEKGVVGPGGALASDVGEVQGRDMGPICIYLPKVLPTRVLNPKFQI